MDRPGHGLNDHCRPIANSTGTDISVASSGHIGGGDFGDNGNPDESDDEVVGRHCYRSSTSDPDVWDPVTSRGANHIPVTPTNRLERSIFRYTETTPHGHCNAVHLSTTSSPLSVSPLHLDSGTTSFMGPTRGGGSSAHSTAGGGTIPPAPELPTTGSLYYLSHAQVRIIIFIILILLLPTAANRVVSIINDIILLSVICVICTFLVILADE